MSGLTSGTGLSQAGGLSDAPGLSLTGTSAALAATGLTFLGLDPGASAYFAAVQAAGGTISPARQVLYNNLFVSLRSAGLLTQLDRLGILAAEDAATAKIDLINPATSVTLVGAPTFTADQGYAATSAANYVDTGAANNGLTLFTQNSAQFTVATLGTRAAGSDVVLIGSALLTGGSVLYPWSSGDTVVPNINQNTIFTGTFAHPGASIKGLYTVNRSTAAACQTYYNGASASTNTQASNTPISQHFLLGCWRNSDGTSVFAVDTSIIPLWAAGSSLSSGDAGTLATILNTYMTAISQPIYTRAWDENAKNAAVLLSNSNLTATGTLSSYEAGRGNFPITSGLKYYWECHWDSLTGTPGESAIGVANVSNTYVTGQYLGITNNALGYFDDGTVIRNDSLVTTLATPVSGDVINVAINGGTAIYFGINGVFSGNPVAGTGGIDISTLGDLYAAYSVRGSGSISATTARFAASSFGYTPPTGYGPIPP